MKPHHLHRLRAIKAQWLILFMLCSAAALPLSCSAARESVSFDFGWKHRTGLKAPSKWDDLPPNHTDPGLHPPEADPNYNDTEWAHVQLPHDGLIVNPPSRAACDTENGCSGRSYIPRHVLWYRKTFYIPQEWISNEKKEEKRQQNVVMWLEFDGSFRNTTIWINGQLVKRHVCGYTPFRVELKSELLLSMQLDSSSGDSKNNDNDNSNNSGKHTIAVFVDPDNGDEGHKSGGSGWWYEGGGLYRHVRLVKTHRVHVAQNGLFVKSQVVSQTSNINTNTNTNTNTDNNNGTGVVLQDNDGRRPEAILEMQASIVNYKRPELFEQKDEEGICYQFRLITPQQNVILLEKHPLPEGPGGTMIVREKHILSSAYLWSTVTPNLYQVNIIISNCDGGNDYDEPKVLDQVSVQHGIRTIHFDANQGFFLNHKPYKIRGFCDHDTFAVVGMALPDRINLFRAQASRSIGGNGRRTSHNPPDPSLLDIYDRLGMIVVDENRLFDDNPEYVKNMATLVKRDRNHPSVIIWSFCNELGCEGKHEKGGPAFQAIVTELDGTRPTLANMFTFNDLLSNAVDVQGFSHQNRQKLDDCHSKLPDKPIFMSECCSCNTMRGEDEGCETLHDNPHTACNQKAFNARCLENLVNASDGVAYAAGTMVWTLFDYYGEPPKAGLHVSSTYGQFDLCGFPKPAAFWFRTQWLLGISDESYDKPFQTHGTYEVQIVESWESPNSWNSTRGNKTRNIHAYSNAPVIELLANGKSQGAHPLVPMTQGSDGSYAEWTSVKWEAGTLTAVALSSDKSTELAKSSRTTNGRAVAISLNLDCPSEATGTGSAVFLDGQDVALVRATVVDAFGKPIHMASNNITFAVLSGPGRVVGTANGDPRSYQPHQSTSQTAYHGIVRAVVQVTSIAGLSIQDKQLLRELHHGPFATTDSLPFFDEEDDIIIEASSPGLPVVQLSIPVSTDPSVASVLAVAQAGAGKAVDFGFGGASSSTVLSSN